uniref:Uncharacterized protein n=1 Tax=Rangifer tarandus platyrhynchus TaxID=3082113 RepID=A0ACB0EDB7_RANTA|nr:unnamed protein product [Rangifer tarandus platyrhynchus]
MRTTARRTRRPRRSPNWVLASGRARPRLRLAREPRLRARRAVRGRFPGARPAAPLRAREADAAWPLWSWETKRSAAAGAWTEVCLVPTLYLLNELTEAQKNSLLAT